MRIDVTDGKKIEVNEYLIARGLRKMMVLYWYQNHNSTIASEYGLKGSMLMAALLSNRADRALVRVSASTEMGEARARQDLTEFVQAFYPQLKRVLPQ
jgi:EpsI family protein